MLVIIRIIIILNIIIIIFYVNNDNNNNKSSVRWLIILSTVQLETPWLENTHCTDEIKIRVMVNSKKNIKYYTSCFTF